MDFKDFQINLLPAISKGYNNEEEFKNDPNVIGSSEIPYGPRKNVINKRNGLILEDKIETLAGKMVHYALQKPEVMYYLSKEINKTLGYTELEINNNRFIELENNKHQYFNVESEKKDLLEVLLGKYLRKHSDIFSNYYTLEIKCTDKPKKMWFDLAPYHIMQLNANLGINRQEYGFLWKIDLHFVVSKSQRWSYIWNNYMLLYPVNFNQKLFDYTIERTKQHFKYIENKTSLSEIPCPEFPEFECENKCRAFCPNPIDKVDIKTNETCFHCKQEIRAGTKALIRNNLMWHYTTEKGNTYEPCVEACKKSFRVKEVE